MPHRMQREKLLPPEPIDRVLQPLDAFLHVEAASGIVLLVCTVIALVAANTSLGPSYLALWEKRLSLGFGSFEMSYSLRHWIDDGLMAIFFFVVGLEVKRELVVGELRDFKSASLPIAAAIGGMVVPALIYFVMQRGKPEQHGWGIPMATDIAFVVGCMAVMSSRVPNSLRVLLLSLAIADDIGAILVIAIGYTSELHWTALALGFGGLGLVLVLRKLGVHSLIVYSIVGVLVWYAFHESGVHATIAGVLLGLLTPARSSLSHEDATVVFDRASAVVRAETLTGTGDYRDRVECVRRLRWISREAVSPLEFVERALHPWVGFVIMPLFALANAGVVFDRSDIADPVALAVIGGLVVGKPLGIVVASWIAVTARLARKPANLSWGAIAGGGCLAGIGFTMALFIAGLALEGHALDAAKFGILIASAISGVLGMATLFVVLRPANAAASTH